MRKALKFAASLGLFLVALGFLTTTTARAADAPPVQLLSLAAKSLDAVSAQAKLIGIDLPPALSAPALEEQFPFIGKGGIATDKPIGIVFFGARVSPEQLMAFVFPVKAGAASLDSLKAMGGKPMDGHPDTVVLNGAVGLRRTGDFLVFSPNAASAVEVNVDKFADSVKSDHTLARAVADVKAVRVAMPDQVKGVLDGISKETLHKANDEAYNAGASFVLDFVKNAVNTIDRVEVSLDRSDKGADPSITAAPVKAPVIATAKSAGMPEGTFARIDLGINIGDTFPSTHDLVNVLVKKLQEDGKDEAVKKQMQSVLTRMAGLILEPAATSVGVEIVNGQPVVYIAQHLSHQTDAIEALRGIVKDFNAISEATKDTSHFELKSYDAGGTSVLRINVIDNHKTEGVLDVVQRGSDVLMVAGPGEEHHIEPLLGAAAGEPIKAAFHLSVAMDKLIAEVATIPNSPLAGLPPDMQKQLGELLKDQKITLSLAHEGDAATLRLSVSDGAIQNLSKLLQLFGVTAPK